MRLLLSLSVVSLFIACSDGSTKNREQSSIQESEITTLPYIGKRDIINRLENGKSITDTIYERIPLFHYINQDSVPVSNNNYSGKIWVAEFFFASCPTICPIMNVEMAGLYQDIIKMGLSDKIQFLSFSIDPDLSLIHI